MSKQFSTPMFPRTLLPLTTALLVASSTTVHAQISKSKDISKALVSLVSYDAQGRTLAGGTAVYIDATGTCAANYSLLRGAARAEITDSKGKTYSVQRILGASSNYDLVKFSTTAHKTDYVSLLTETPLVGTPATLISGQGKNCHETQRLFTQIEDFDQYHYYHIGTTSATAPLQVLLSPEARLVGFAQRNGTTDTTDVTAIDARFLSDLRISSTAAFNSDLKAIAIPKALPEGSDDALTYLYMLRGTDSLTYITALNDFIEAYPHHAEGYVSRAAFSAGIGHYEESDKDFHTAFSKAGTSSETLSEDVIHGELSKTIFQKCVYAPQPPYSDWTLHRAAEEAKKAYALRPLGAYLLQQGRAQYAEGAYREAYKTFRQLAEQSAAEAAEGKTSSTATAEAWMFAARSAGADTTFTDEQIVALMDSAIAASPRPLTSTTAGYLFERGTRLQALGEHRKAVSDFTAYENAIGTRQLNAQFYYIREQSELECRMYQQALDDIRTAIARAPQETAYLIEEALVLLRAGLYKETVSLCRQLLEGYTPDSADCYKLMGIAYGELKQKQQAVSALTKAKELGDPTAAQYLQKYQ
jgi:hypothetical protein